MKLHQIGLPFGENPHEIGQDGVSKSVGRSGFNEVGLIQVRERTAATPQERKRGERRQGSHPCDHSDVMVRSLQNANSKFHSVGTFSRRSATRLPALRERSIFFSRQPEPGGPMGSFTTS